MTSPRIRSQRSPDGTPMTAQLADQDSTTASRYYTSSTDIITVPEHLCAVVPSKDGRSQEHASTPLISNPTMHQADLRSAGGTERSMADMNLLTRKNYVHL